MNVNDCKWVDSIKYPLCDKKRATKKTHLALFGSVMVFNCHYRAKAKGRLSFTVAQTLFVEKQYTAKKYDVKPFIRMVTAPRKRCRKQPAGWTFASGDL